MAPKITVHWLADSRSQRVLFLLEELGLPYEVVKYERDWDTFLIPAEGFEQVYKLKRFPAIVLEDAEAGFPTPTPLAESGAIFETLLALYGPASPLAATLPSALSPALAARHRFLLHWCEGTAMFHMVTYLVMARTPKKFGWLTAPMARLVCGAIVSGFVLPNLRRTFEFLEAELGEGEWFVGGQFGACDVMLSVLWELLLALPPNTTLSPADFPRLAAWFARVRAREAWGRAEERGGESRLGGYFA